LLFSPSGEFARHGKRFPAPLLSRGMVYLALGNTAEARSYLNVAAASREPFPGDREAREALKKLAP